MCKLSWNIKIHIMEKFRNVARPDRITQCQAAADRQMWEK
jgi:hypothetical protein